MRINNVDALLLVGVLCGAVSSSAAATAGRCRAHCKEIRSEVLGRVETCLPAFTVPPVPNMYHACIDGRKKAFDRACTPLCARAELTLTSFDNCQAKKKYGRKYVDWCRKGYDSILQNPEAFLVDRLEKEEEKQHPVVENEPVEPTKSNTDPVNKSDVVREPVRTKAREREPEPEANNSEFAKDVDDKKKIADVTEQAVGNTARGSEEKAGEDGGTVEDIAEEEMHKTLDDIAETIKELKAVKAIVEEVQELEGGDGDEEGTVETRIAEVIEELERGVDNDEEHKKSTLRGMKSSENGPRPAMSLKAAEL